jgi:hypothetical protein
VIVHWIWDSEAIIDLILTPSLIWTKFINIIRYFVSVMNQADNMAQLRFAAECPVKEAFWTLCLEQTSKPALRFRLNKLCVSHSSFSSSVNALIRQPLAKMDCIVSLSPYTVEHDHLFHSDAVVWRRLAIAELQLCGIRLKCAVSIKQRENKCLKANVQ